MDELTGLLNRRGLLEHGDRYIELTRSARHSILIGFIDIDRLKLINDSEGHAVGDSVIAATGRALQWVLDRGYLAARIGGDEFVVVFDVRDDDDMTKVQHQTEGGLRRLAHSVTVGWACHRGDLRAGLGTMLSESDMQMLSLKKARETP